MESQSKHERILELQDKDNINDILYPITREQYIEEATPSLKEGLKKLSPEEQQEWIDLSQKERLVKGAALFFKESAAKERFLAEVEEKGPKSYEEITKIRRRKGELAQKMYAPEK